MEILKTRRDVEMKKIYKIVLVCLMFISIAPIHSMLMKARQGIQKESQIGRRNIFGKVPQADIAKSSPGTTLQQARAWLSKQATALKDRFSGISQWWWWKKEPSIVVQKEIAVPVVPTPQESIVIVEEQPKKIIKTPAQIEAEDILAQLKGPNPWNYSEGIRHNMDLALKSPLTEKIRNFLLDYLLDTENIEIFFVNLVTTNEGCTLLTNMCKDSAIATEILPLVRKNYQLADSDTAVDFINLLATVLLNISSDKLQQEELLVDTFFKNISAYSFVIKTGGYGAGEIAKLLPENNNIRLTAVLNILANNLEQYDLSVKDYILELSSFLERMLVNKIEYLKKEDIEAFFYKIFKRHHGLVSPEDAFRRIIEKKKILKDIISTMDAYKDIPSSNHIRKYSYGLANLKLDKINNNEFKRLLIECCKTEQEAVDKDEIFYHGRRWRYKFLSDVYSMLYSHQTDNPLIDFIFTHLVEQGVRGSQKFIDNEKQKREQLLKEGNPFPILTHSSIHHASLSEQKRAAMEQMASFGARQSLLFLNKFLFGNINKRGSCTMAYVLEDSNVGRIDFSLKDIFSMFGYADVYSEYEKELDDLQKEHDQLSQCGELLQILVPKNIVDKCVYYTTSGGPKKSFRMPDGSTTTDVKMILDDLDKNPEDIVEFALINTQDEFGGLNPSSGIKIFSRGLFDAAKMAAFQNKLKLLFVRIKKSLKEKDLQKKRAALERE